MDALTDFMPARPLTRQDAKTLVLSALGGALEFYDFIIFVFFTAVIGRLFFPADMPDWLRQFQAFGIFAAGYLARPLGGVVMAHFGDRVGRKKMFSLGVFLMAVPTLLIGFLPTYESIGFWAPVLLLVMRMLQGAAIGGEVPGAWVFVSEHVPARRVGFGCSLLTSGLTTGILIGSLTASAITVHFTPAEVQAFGWRIPFILGGLFGLVVVYLRRWLSETPVFEEIRRLEKLSRSMPLKEVLQGHRGAIALSVAATWMLTAAIVVVILMTPTLLGRLYGVPMPAALTANSLATLCLSVSCVLVGLAVDRFGPLRVMAVGCPCLLLAVYALYLGTPAMPGLLPLFYAVAGAAVGIIAVVPILMVHAFPAPVRFSGISFSYNLSYAVFGGITPLAVPLATVALPLFPAHYVALACVLAPGLVLLFIGSRARHAL
ncbi:MAG: MHS family MFS transporter [Telmatospirillum sp.]|nr:MHS family MFS transporter [Telmatospirillum sp.]